MNRGKRNRWKGLAGENLAAEFLVHKGIRILARNYRFDKGEIDLVCKDGDELVFVEVKTRTSTLYGDPEEAVNEVKQNQLRKVAEGYCEEFQYEETFYRFDIVTVMIEGDSSAVRHLTDAF